MKRQFRSGFGRLTAPQLTAATAAGDFVREQQSALQRLGDRFSEAPPLNTWILAEITSYTAIGSTSYRWEYGFQQIWIDENLNVANGFYTHTNTAKALNMCEMVNDGALYEGPGWNMATAPTGFEIRPIQKCVVQLWPFTLQNGAFRWVFFAANVLDGECPEPEP